MRLPRWSWWQWTLAAFAGLVVLGAVGRCIDPTVPMSEPRSDTTGTVSTVLNSRQVRQDPFPTFALLVRPSGSGSNLEDEARKLCGAAAFCQISAWSDDNLRARGFPFTDREAAGVVFSYNVNRTTGFEQALWDCQTFAGVDPTGCLAQLD